MRSKRLLTALAIGIASVAVATSAVNAKLPDSGGDAVCHVAGGSGRVVELQLPEPAVRAHLGHGDVLLSAYGYCP